MTEFYLVTTSKDYAACHALIRQQGIPDGPLMFPTVCAKRDGKVIGVAGRAAYKKTCVLYRLAAATSNPGLLLIRLVEAFEEVLRRYGMDRYLIACDKRNKKLNEYIERIISEKPYAESADDLWYIRRMA